MIKLAEKIKLILNLRCGEASKLTSRSLDGPLPWHETLATGGHYLACRYCRHFRRQLLFLRTLQKRVRESEQQKLEEGPVLDSRVKQRLKDLYRK